jgi:methyl-accepting chemotaxis protein
MTIVSLVATLALQATALGARDTVLVRELPPVRSSVEQVFFYAAGLSSLLVLTLLVLLVLAVFWMRRAALAAGERVDDLLTELRPMLKQAAETGESIRKTVDRIQTEVGDLADGAHESGARVKRTVGELADRVDDFNDLLGKVHTRADAVVTVAGTAMDGIAWGARKLRERSRRKHVTKKS